jgi:hypothetical protein
MTKDQTLVALGNQLDSFYSLQQVIDIVKNIEVGPSRKITVTDIQRAIDNVVDIFERNTEDVVEYTNVEFKISYDNRIEVESVRLSMDSIREILENNFMDFGEVEVEVKEEKEENEL